MITVTITPEELDALISRARNLESNLRSWLDQVNQGAATEAQMNEARHAAQALRARAAELASESTP